MRVRVVSTRPVEGVRAGSALLAVGPRLLVVGDDAYAVAWVDPLSGEATHVPLEGDGAPLPKPAKPDLEAAFVGPDGAVWVLGSGSLPHRGRVFRLSGPSLSVVSSYDGDGLHAALAAALEGPPNIEGAVVVAGSLLRLAHRSTGRRPDVLLDVAGFLDDPASARVVATRELGCPDVGGVPAHVTDLALAGDGRIACLAAAEDTLDPVLDGPVAGTLLGFVDGPWAVIHEADGAPSLRKAEGLVLDADLTGGWFVTDRDDPALPAELCRFTID